LYFTMAIRQTRVKDVLATKNNFLLLLSERDTIHSTLKKFAAHRINAAPLFLKERHVGFIDLLDILTYLLNVLEKNSDTPFHDFSSIQDEYLHQEVDFSLKSVANLVDFSGRNPFLGTLEETPIISILPIFAKGIHRMAVTNQQDDIIGVLSQSDIIQFLAKNTSGLGSKANSTLEELGCAYKDVVKVKSDTITFEAFKLIQTSKVSGVAVVDSDDVIIGNLSASDLKILNSVGSEPNLSNFDSLFLPLQEVLGILVKLNEKSGVITCTPQTIFGELIQILAKERIHRVYCVDAAKHPVGVLSLSDICRVFLIPG